MRAGGQPQPAGVPAVAETLPDDVDEAGNASRPPQLPKFWN